MLVSALDQALSDVLSAKVLQSVYAYLRDKHDLTREEVPYRLDTYFSVLESAFGVKGARTIGRLAARILYTRLNLQFEDDPDFTLKDYLEQAKLELNRDP
jgi:hypothetical protein